MRVLALLALVVPAAAWGAPASYTFGGFSPGEREYWKRGPAGDLLCEPPATCRPVEKKDVKGFVKPARSRRFAATIVDDSRVRLADGERELGSFAPGGRVTAVNANVFVAPGEGHVAVEYEVVDRGQKRGDVVVFALGEAPERPEPAPKASPAAAGNAY